MSEMPEPKDILGQLTLSRLRSEIGDDTVRRYLNAMRIAIIEGQSDPEIMQHMQWSPEVVTLLRQTIVEQEKVVWQRPPEETFIDYLFRQEGFMRELDLVVGEYSAQRDSKIAAASVSAIRAKSEILDKVINLGKELGILRPIKTKQKPTEIEGFSVADLTDVELRGLLMRVMQRMQKLVERYGDVGAKAIDVTPRPVIGVREGGKVAHGGSGARRRNGGRATVRSTIVQRTKAADKVDS